MRNKAERQKIIREIVREKVIKTQKDLVGELRKAGINVTQATVSRDIDELKLEKTPKGNYGFLEDGHLERMIKDLAQSIVDVGNLVLVKCSAGAASGAAAALDGVGWVEILGTIAGDDTILVVTADGDSGRAVGERLRRMVEK
ncbi:MAG: ArgR family transcriptional regulator [Actinomycetota bacterium]|nr:ArgR family transcriptional regulator [Actinomycetota bacterium]